MSQTRQFQAFVLESAYMSKRISLEDYIWKTLNIWDKYGLNDISIIQLFGHFQANRDTDIVKTVFNEYEHLPLHLEHYLNECWIDEDGNLTRQAKENLGMNLEEE